jgi:hypothetical protein
MRIRLIHGIHSPEGDSNMSALRPKLINKLPEANIELFEYGFMGFWAARWDNPDVAKDLSQAFSYARKDEPEVWITHSNGAAIAYMAVNRFGAEPNMIININPALDRWRAANVDKVHVFHSKEDSVVALSSILIGNVWGDQGKYGYGPTWLRSAKKDYVVNHNASEIGGVYSYMYHCGLFDPSRIEFWSQYIADLIKKEYNI